MCCCSRCVGREVDEGSGRSRPGREDAPVPSGGSCNDGEFRTGRGSGAESARLPAEQPCETGMQSAAVVPPYGARQARYWLCTIPRDLWVPQLPSGAQWIKGQPELGVTGYRHWQCLVSFPKKVSLAGIRQCLPNGGHYEPSRSARAESYVWKDETRDGDQFEFGAKAIKRNCEKDWDQIKLAALSGDLDSIPSDIYIRYYGALRRIAADNAIPVGIEREVSVYWGPTGTGKSRRAWQEAAVEGASIYAKDPRTKFWCGYKGQKHVVVDEFRGG